MISPTGGRRSRLPAEPDRSGADAAAPPLCMCHLAIEAPDRRGAELAPVSRWASTPPETRGHASVSAHGEAKPPDILLTTQGSWLLVASACGAVLWRPQVRDRRRGAPSRGNKRGICARCASPRCARGSLQRGCRMSTVRDHALAKWLRPGADHRHQGVCQTEHLPSNSEARLLVHTVGTISTGSTARSARQMSLCS